MRRSYSSSIGVALVLIGTVAAAAQLGGAEPQSEKSPAGTAESIESNVARLVADLDADSRKTRSNAEKSLLELGPAALEFLPAPAQLSTPATREAVRRIRVALELQKATASVKESRATLNGTQSVEIFLQRLSKQTGNAIDIERLPAELRQRKVPLALENVPFWRAIDELCRQVGMRIEGVYSGQLRLASGGAAKLEAQSKANVIDHRSLTAGPFRIAIRSAKLREKRGDNNPRRVRFEFAILGEPRLRPLFLTFAAADFQAVTEAGKLLVPSNPTAKIEQPFGEQGALAQIDFDVPDETGVDEVKLQGRFSALTAAAPEKFEFTDVFKATGTSRRRGGVTVTMDEVEKPNAGGDSSITIIVAYDTGGPAFESHRSWYFQNDAWLETADRKRVEMSEPPRVERETDGALTVQYRFSGLPADREEVRFNYVAPTLLIDVPATFEFDRLPVAGVER